jgi:hypothetical protein
MSVFRSALQNGLNRLFHYQPYNKSYLENTIQRRLIRFSRPSAFNDPWDCKPSFYVPDDKAELEALVAYLHSASAKHAPTLTSLERDKRAQFYLNNSDKLRSDLSAASREIWTQMDERYRVYCLSARPRSQLMWSHYADHHRGVCLDFDVHTSDFSSATEVKYSAAYPNFLLNDDTDLSPFYTKSSDWAYEEEYRLVAQEEGKELGSGTMMTRDDGMFCFSDGALVSVIIGSSMDDTNKRELEAICQAAGIPIRTATLVPHRYELTFDPPL